MPTLVPAADVREFFRDAVTEVRRRQRLTVRPETEWYLVELLAGHGGPTDAALAELLQRAIESRGAERAGWLRQLGDEALYSAGYFSDSLVRGAVGPSYYVGMGQRAYEALAGMTAAAITTSLRPVYAEMAAKFQRLVDLLAELYETSLRTAPDGLLKLYERYLRTDSERLRWKLQSEGLLCGVAPRNLN